MNINNAAFQWLFWLCRAFKHSDFHAVKVSVSHVHPSRRPCAFLAERTDDKIQGEQVMAQAQVVHQVTLQGEGGKKRGRAWVNFVITRATTHQRSVFKFFQGLAATFNTVTNCIYQIAFGAYIIFSGLRFPLIFENQLRGAGTSILQPLLSQRHRNEINLLI